MPLIQARRGYADNQTLLDLARLLVEQWTILSRKGGKLCYDYIVGSDNAKSYAGYFPDALNQRELALSEQIIRTAATRPSPSEETLDAYWHTLGVGLETLQ